MLPLGRDLVKCPSCGSDRSVNYGQIHEVQGLFKLEHPGNLYVCPKCSLRFRYPYPEGEDLIEKYKRIVASIWSYEDNRTDYKLAQQAVAKIDGVKTVLDVGCFRGDFLKSLPQDISIFGIEPSPEARKVAEDRGVKFIAHSIDEIDASNGSFDVVTMFDVIEHIPRPLEALQKLSSLIKPGGVLIIATGNTRALPWKVLPLDYWYYFPEHVSFFSRDWFYWASKKVNMDVTSIAAFSHFENSLYVRWRQLFEAITYRLVRCKGCGNFLKYIYPFSRAAQWVSAPTTRAWSDHELIVLRKKYD